MFFPPPICFFSPPQSTLPQTFSVPGFCQATKTAAVAHLGVVVETNHCGINFAKQEMFDSICSWCENLIFLVNFGEVFLISKSIKRYQKYPLGWSPLPVIVSCNSQLKVLVKGIAYKGIVMIVMVLVVITGRQPKTAPKKSVTSINSIDPTWMALNSYWIPLAFLLDFHCISRNPSGDLKTHGIVQDSFKGMCIIIYPPWN